MKHRISPTNNSISDNSAKSARLTKVISLFALFALFALFILFCSFLPARARETIRTVHRGVNIKAKLLKGNRVQISWDASGFESANKSGASNNNSKRIDEIHIIRSTSDLRAVQLHPAWYPIVRYDVTSKGLKGDFIDRYTADGARYYYIMEIIDAGGKVYHSPVTATSTKRKALPKLRKPVILVDKAHYILDIIDNGRRVKRYAVCLGRNPYNRKLHQDCATTPEGIYHINGLQPNYAFYKAFDIDYPNNVDLFRYNFAAREKLLPKKNGGIPGIGGEIQIHAGAPIMKWNWSYGCIMIKNSDIDELFKQRAIRVGTKVIIVGWELTRKDLSSINKKRSAKEIKLIQRKLKKAGFNPGPIDGVQGGQTMTALGLLQKKWGLPITCQLDKRTVDLLKRIKVGK